MLGELQQKARVILTENASAILTAGGVVGTVGTAVLTGRATFKAAALIQQETEKRQDDPSEDRFAVQRMEAVKMVWPLYLAPIGVGGVTIGAIVMANRISATKAAALAAAYSLSERRFEEYREKALEKLGVNKEEKLRDEIAQDRVTNNPPDKQVVILAGGDVLCYDMLTGRYFRSTVENIKKAENRINTALLNHQYASLSEFYEEIGLEPTNYSDEVGWNLNRDGSLEVKFSTTMSTDDKPCITIDFNTAPHPEYTQLY